MTFVAVDQDGRRLRALTGVLAKSFPGCTLFEYRQLNRAAEFIMENTIDAVFVSEGFGEDTAEMVEYLEMNKKGLPVYIIHDGAGAKKYKNNLDWPISVESAKQQIRI